MLDFLRSFFRSQGWGGQPQFLQLSQFAGLSQPEGLYFGSEALTVLALFAFAILLLTLIRQWTDLPLQRIGFGLFLVLMASGVVHFFIPWARGLLPIYLLSLVQIITAIVLSCTTAAIALFLPKFLRAPSQVALDVREQPPIDPMSEQQRMERQHAEERLRLLESAVVHANDVILITEAEPIDYPGPRIVYVNEAFTRMTGYSSEEVVGKSPRILQGPKTDRAVLDKIREALLQWQPVQAEMINYRKDHSEFWVDLNIVPIADEKGWFTHWMSIQRDITERKLTEEKVVVALARERELGELKSQFISNVSHEFRTPLTTIQSAADLLEQFLLSPAEKGELFAQIHTGVQHIVRLLEESLFVEKANSTELICQPTVIDLEQFCHLLVAELESNINQFNIIQLVIPHEIGSVYLDDMLLKHILSRLLTNAVQYSLSHPAIQLLVQIENRHVVFQIKDQGIGIPEAEKPHVFDCFYRAKNIGTISGAGMGLFVVKRCVDVHGGAIALESKEGCGTTFTVKLPLK